MSIDGITKGSFTADNLMHQGVSVGRPEFRGVFINIDKVFFTHNDGTEEVAKDWLKEVIKEAIVETKSYIEVKGMESE